MDNRCLLRFIAWLWMPITLPLENERYTNGVEREDCVEVLLAGVIKNIFLHVFLEVEKKYIFISNVEIILKNNFD